MCTIMGAAGACTRDGAAWIASTSDNPYAEGPRKPVVMSVAGNGRRLVHTPCLQRQADGALLDLGSDRGLNEAGLAWTRSWVVPGETPPANGLPASEWFLRLGAECASVAEAIAFIEETPRGPGTQGNYILADAAGALACLEVGYRRLAVARYGPGGAGGVVARVNCYVDREMRAIDDSERGNPLYYATSPTRQARAEHLLQQHCGALDLACWKTLLADTENLSVPPQAEHGASICSLGRTHGTVSAEIIEPAAGVFHYTYGWPNAAVSSALLAEPISPPLRPWGQWRAFVLAEMIEAGAYSDWSGELTALGARHFSRRGS